MIDLSLILTVSAPWIVGFAGEFDEILKQLRSVQTHNPEIRLRLVVLEGRSMTTLDAQYDELTRGFELPDYFGRNANALDECVNDLDWMDFGAMVVLVRDAQHVLSLESSEKLGSLLDVLWDAGDRWSHPVSVGEEWDRPAISFHTILVASDLSRISQSGFQHAIPVLRLL